MLRCSSQSWSIALVGVLLFLCPAPWAQAQEPPPDPEADLTFRLANCLYELREAKEDVREVGIPDKERLEILGGIDSAIEQLKKTIVAMGGPKGMLPPPKRPCYPNHKHLRHAIVVLKTAREELKTQEGVPEDVRKAAHQEIDKVVTHLEKAITYVK